MLTLGVLPSNSMVQILRATTSTNCKVHSAQVSVRAKKSKGKGELRDNLRQPSDRSEAWSVSVVDDAIPDLSWPKALKSVCRISKLKALGRDTE